MSIYAANSSKNTRNPDVCGQALFIVGVCFLIFKIIDDPNSNSSDSTSSTKSTEPLTREAKAKEMLAKHRMSWKYAGPDEAFLEFLEIAPEKYAKDVLPYMVTSNIGFQMEDIELLWGNEILSAAAKNPDIAVFSTIKFQLRFYFNYPC